MGLGNRNARRHETIRAAAVRSEDYWDFAPGETVMTVDGFLGKVQAVYDGPIAGTEEYEVVLQNGLGGGTYTASQLKATTDHTSAQTNTASIDYPELQEVLEQRLDPGRYPSSPMPSMLSSRTAELHPDDERDETNEGKAPGVCDNGHLQWGDHCPACRDADPEANAMVVNEGDKKPQDVEDIKVKQPVTPEDLGHTKKMSAADKDDEAEPCEDCGGDHATEDHDSENECEICGSGDHESDDHEDEPEEHDDYIGTNNYRRGGWSVHHGDSMQGMNARCAGPHHDLPDLETAAHVLMHCQHDRGYFPNVWDNSYGSGSELSGTYHAHVERWGPNIGGRGPVHQGAEPLPHQELPSDNDLRGHLMHHHELSSDDLTEPWSGRHFEHQDLLDAHADSHLMSGCPVEGSRCPWDRLGHTHNDAEQELHSDNREDNESPHLVHGPGSSVPHYNHDPHEDRQRLQEADEHVPGLHMDDPYIHNPHREVHDMPQEGESMHDWIRRTTPQERFSKCHDCRGRGVVRKPGIPPEGVNPWEHKQTCSTCEGSGHLRSDGTPARERGGHLGRLLRLASNIDTKDWYERYNQHDGCTVCGDSEHDTHEHDLVDDAINPSLQEAHFLRGNPTGPTKYSAFDPYTMVREAALNPSFGFHVLAAWRDVRNKAKRIAKSGHVRMLADQNGYVVADVKGDHNVYRTLLQRVPGKQSVATWECGCKWASYSWGRSGPWKKYEGRMCSHALALNYEAQRRGMFGAEITPDKSRPRWLKKRTPVVMEWDKDNQRNVTAAKQVYSEDPYVADRDCEQCGNEFVFREGSHEPFVCDNCEQQNHDEVSAELRDRGPNDVDWDQVADVFGRNRHPAPEQSDPSDSFRGPDYQAEDPFAPRVLRHSSLDTPVVTFIKEALRQGEDPEEVALLINTLGAINSPFGEPAPPQVARPPGPTKPRDPSENPAQSGFLTAQDPQGWNQQNPQDLGDRTAASRKMFALISNQGSAMHEAALCHRHHQIPELREMAVENARQAGDWNGNEQFTDVTGNDDVYCPACGDQTLLQRLQSDSSLRAHAHGDHSEPQHGPYHEDEPDDAGLHLHDEYKGQRYTSMPGLGCPHCDEGFFDTPARTRHIREQHPGEYSGPDEEMMLLKQIRPDIFGDIDKTSGLDDAVFEPEMATEASIEKDAWAQLVVPLVRALAPAVVKQVAPRLMGEVAEQGGKQFAKEVGKGVVKTVVPNLMKQKVKQVEQDTERAEQEEEQAVQGQEQMVENIYGPRRQATLHDEPEPALPFTDGADDDEINSLEYGYPTDPGNSNPTGMTTEPGDLNIKGDPTSLEPEDPSFVTTGKTASKWSECTTPEGHGPWSSSGTCLSCGFNHLDHGGDICEHCQQPILPNGGSWVDRTEGDACEESPDGAHGPSWPDAASGSGSSGEGFEDDLYEHIHDPVAGRDLGPCNNYAPDTDAPDLIDRDICTNCFHGPGEHGKGRQAQASSFFKDDHKSGKGVCRHHRDLLLGRPGWGWGYGGYYLTDHDKCEFSELHSDVHGPSTEGGSVGDGGGGGGAEGSLHQGSVADIVEQFQKSAGAKSLGTGGMQQARDNSEIAAAAQQYLAKESMAHFSPAQQQELINEGEGVRASNLDRLEITGTHYEALDAALGDDDDDEEWLA